MYPTAKIKRRFDYRARLVDTDASGVRADFKCVNIQERIALRKRACQDEMVLRGAVTRIRSGKVCHKEVRVNITSRVSDIKRNLCVIIDSPIAREVARTERNITLSSVVTITGLGRDSGQVISISNAINTVIIEPDRNTFRIQVVCNQILFAKVCKNACHYCVLLIVIYAVLRSASSSFTTTLPPGT